MNKDKVEGIFRRMGLVPLVRQKIKDYDVFVGEGYFDRLPERDFWPEPKHFPHGVYVTFWWLGRDEKLLGGRPLFFDKMHDHIIVGRARQRSRINSAIKDAENHVKQLNRMN